MNVDTPYYPPGPANTLSPGAHLGLPYKLYVGAVLLSFFVFFAFYLALLAGAAYGIFALVKLALELSAPAGIMFWAFFAAAAGINLLVFFFLLKGLFKRQLADRSGYIELREEEEPKLFAFLRQLCRDTNAPMPRRVYLCPDVNAGVFYDSSILSLIWPVKKNLLIGLGMVNTLNLSEFKAVLAHEFGHFSQRTMRINSYVFVLNNVFTDMVYGRDGWDEVLSRWRRKSTALAGPAWLLSALVWALRRAMGMGLKLINAMDAGLSRHMEFHADRVAVSVTGSDAIVHALLRTDYGNQCFAQTLYDLRHAADHGLHTSDVFYHHTRAMDFLRIAQNDSQLGRPPALPQDPSQQVRVFERGPTHAPTFIGASHPSHAEREENAKRHYVRSELDERSPWLLFEDPAATRRAVSQKMAHQYLASTDEPTLDDPGLVQTFIDDDHAEIIFDPRYLGMYDNRFIEPGDIDALLDQAAIPEVEALDHQQLLEEIDRLYGEELHGFMDSFKTRIKELQMLETVIGEQVSWGKTFVFRGEKYRPSDAQSLFSQVYSEMERDRSWFSSLDERVFIAHYRAAELVAPESARELRERYTFHATIQEMTRNLRNHQPAINQVIALLSSGELTEEAVDFIFEELLRLHGFLDDLLARACELHVPLLNNISHGTTLRSTMLKEELISNQLLHEQQLDSDWLRTFIGQFEDVLDRLARMRRKSLGAILTHQESICLVR